MKKISERQRCNRTNYEPLNIKNIFCYYQPNYSLVKLIAMEKLNAAQVFLDDKICSNGNWTNRKNNFQDVILSKAGGRLVGIKNLLH